ncbi:hypothetical protein VARIO8X_60576 [Burkholderiales bacterium 8X]|nr:hypothetical protein VARIO8X_60576 [Burkholderiales bacterium 8X]
MSHRYRLDSSWFRDPDLRRIGVPDVLGEVGTGAVDCLRSTWNPVVRSNEDGPGVQVEVRRWGFHRNYPQPGEPRQKAKREHFIADGSQVTRLPSFKFAFAIRRCLIPISSWQERRQVGGKKAVVDFSIAERPVFAVAGLYETSNDIRTGEPIETYIMLAGPPRRGLGDEKLASPLVLAAADYLPWLEDRLAAQELARGGGQATEFVARPVKASIAEVFGGFRRRVLGA